MARIANQFLLSGKVPARLEVVMEMLRSFRRISQERINWCRHLVIWEDLSVTGNPEIAFQELPTRKCHCEKFGHTSETPSTDAATVILLFKEAFCTSCSSRLSRREPQINESHEQLCALHRVRLLRVTIDSRMAGYDFQAPLMWPSCYTGS